MRKIIPLREIKEGVNNDALKKEYLELCSRIKPNRYTYDDTNSHHEGDEFHWEIKVDGPKAEYKKYIVPLIEFGYCGSIEEFEESDDFEEHRENLPASWSRMSDDEKKRYVYDNYGIFIPGFEYWKDEKGKLLPADAEYRGLTVLSFSLSKDGKTLTVAEAFDSGKWKEPSYGFDVRAEDYPEIVSRYDFTSWFQDSEKLYEPLGIDINQEVFFLGYEA